MIDITRFPGRAGATFGLVVLCSCLGGNAGSRGGTAVDDAAIDSLLSRSLTRIDTLARRYDDALMPVKLLRPREEEALRQYPNAEHVARARRLGVPRPRDRASVEGLARDGRLVRLADSTAYWTIRPLESSMPYLTPSASQMLEALGRRFQDRLGEMGLPAFRLEITSALRTASLQQNLRTTNENAARGASSHEFGTTVDVSYFSYAAPAELPITFDVEDVRWLAPHLRHVAALAFERVAAQRSRELQAILGHVLAQMQSEGAVLVTLETLQPVYHLTVAR